MISLENFCSDKQGRRYMDVVNDNRIKFQEIIHFFNQKEIRQRLLDSEIHHKRPALAGVIVELENLDAIKKFFSTYDAHTTIRFRQAVGVLVKLHMKKMGWYTTSVKGSLGTRDPMKKYENTKGSLSKWFLRAEHYNCDSEK